MAALREILAELDGLLNPAGFDDYCPNGLQVEGRGEVRHVVSGVSASVELFEAALLAGADLVLVHHGIFWRGDDATVRGAQRSRLKLLLENDLSLVAYHLPLDAHPEHGNNARLARGLGLEDLQPFARHAGRAIGIRGCFAAEGISREALRHRVAELVGRDPLAFLEGPEAVRTLGIVSGGGADSVREAAALGLDAFLTGEPEEWARAFAREAKISFLAAGHAATETLGVQALGEHLARRLGVRHSFISIENPV